MNPDNIVYLVDTRQEKDFNTPVKIDTLDKGIQVVTESIISKRDCKPDRDKGLNQVPELLKMKIKTPEKYKKKHTS